MWRPADRISLQACISISSISNGGNTWLDSNFDTAVPDTGSAAPEETSAHTLSIVLPASVFDTTMTEDVITKSIMRFRKKSYLRIDCSEQLNTLVSISLARMQGLQR